MAFVIPPRIDNLIGEAINDRETEFRGDRNTPEFKALVRDLLPLNEINFKIINVAGTGKKWKAKVKCKILNKVEVAVFLKDYAELNNETIKILLCKKVAGRSPYS